MKREGIYKRPGQFRITSEMFYLGEAHVRAVMREVLIWNCQRDWSGDGITYYAYSNLFEEEEEGCKLPSYTFELGRVFEEVVVKRAVRVDEVPLTVPPLSSFGRVQELERRLLEEQGRNAVLEERLKLTRSDAAAVPKPRGIVVGWDPEGD